MWSNYEIASGLDNKTNEVRAATLKVLMGQKCFRVLQSFNFMETQLQNSATIIDRLNHYLLPRTNVIYERFKFNTRNQSPSESIDEYVTNLKHLATTCQFGNLGDDLIRDRIVLGVHDDKVRARLLRENALFFGSSD